MVADEYDKSLGEKEKDQLSPMKDDDYDYSLSLEHCINKMGVKFAAVVTKNQYAIEVDGFTHEEMIKDLVEKIRPDIEMDYWCVALNPDESFFNGNVLIAGYAYFITVVLPRRELLSKEQFDCLKNILLTVKRFNDNNHERGFGRDYELFIAGENIMNISDDNYHDNIDELIEKIGQFISDDVSYPEEKIIGVNIRCRNESTGSIKL